MPTRRYVDTIVGHCDLRDKHFPIDHRHIAVRQLRTTRRPSVRIVGVTAQIAARTMTALRRGVAA
jgi:hypothetical protein